nr:MFS transporter [Sphingomonas ginsenosidivorax]
MQTGAGRRPAMIVSFSLVGLSVDGLALTPGYASIGMAAPVLAVLFRLLPGFALGGEVGPRTALLLESAPIRRRGLIVSLQAMSADRAVMIAGLVGVALAPVAVDTWSWRLAVVLELTILPFALAARRTLVETLKLEETLPRGAGVYTTRRVVELGVLMLAVASVSNKVLVYLGFCATATLGVIQQTGFACVMLVGLGGVICDPLSG